MNFVPTEDHVKINLEEGLAELMRGKVDKLYSEGLEEDEYIHYIKEKGFCFEDGTVIGKSFVTATENLIYADWTTKHPFYIKLDYEKEKEKWLKNYWDINDENKSFAKLAFDSNGYNVKSRDSLSLIHLDNKLYEKKRRKLMMQNAKNNN